MTPFVDLSVIIALHFPVGFRRDHGGCAARIKVFEQLIGIKSLVSQQRIKRHVLDQWSDAFHVVGLPRQQKEPHQVAKRIDQCHDLGRQPAARAPDGLSLSPPFAPVAFW